MYEWGAKKLLVSHSVAVFTSLRDPLKLRLPRSISLCVIRLPPAFLALLVYAVVSLTPFRVHADGSIPAGNIDSANSGTDDVQAESDLGRVLRWSSVVARIDDPKIQIDGVVDEPSWTRATQQSTFYVVSPDTLEVADVRTEIRFFYNDKGFYFAASMDQDDSTLVERLSSRDRGFINRDYISLYLDTSGTGRYGFWFQLSLGDSRSDGVLLPERNFSDSWDGAWYGRTARSSDGWSAEMHIPWSIVNMPRVEGARTIGVFVQRRIAHTDTRFGWPALPSTRPKFLSEFKPLILQDVRPRQQFNLFPYVASSYDDVNERKEESMGVDLFWRPSTNFQVASTIRPDFGTVESDSVIINLSAIETFFPEKRLFFIEGQEIFHTTSRSSGYGSSMVLLHTRRIGQRPIRPDLPEDADFSSANFRQPTDLIGAVKSTGQFGPIRFGILGALEDDTVFAGTRADGESVFVTQSGREFSAMRVLFESSDNGYRGIGVLSTDMSHPTVKAQSHAIDGQFSTDSGKYRVESQLIMSDVSDQPNGYGGFADIYYAPSQGVSHRLSLDKYDGHLDLRHSGYLSRNGLEGVSYRYQTERFPDGRFRGLSTRVSVDYVTNLDDEIIRAELDARHEMTFHNRSRLRFEFEYSPTRFDDRNGYDAGSFRLNPTRELGYRFISDTSQRLYLYLRGDFREETLEGTSMQHGVSLNWRPVDRLTFSMNLSYNDRDGWLLYRGNRQFNTFEAQGYSPRLTTLYFLSAKQHLRFDFEWQAISASQRTRFVLPVGHKKLQPIDPTDAGTNDEFTISQLSMQLRYRWEMAPMSDLFVVYTMTGELPDGENRSLSDQFNDTFNNPVSEGLILKLRHRIGS